MAEPGERAPSPRRLFNRNFLLLVFCHFLQGLGWSCMLLLPRYFNVLGESREDIGILMAAGSFGGLVVRPIVGWALDYHSKRLCLSIGSIFLAAGMLGLSDSDPNFDGLLVARVSVGIGAGTLFTGYFAFVAQHIPRERRTEGLALFGISGIFPLSMNAFTDHLFGDPSIVQTLYPLLTAPIILSGIIVWLVHETSGQISEQSGEVRFKFKDLFGVGLIPVWLATLIFSTLVAAFMAFATLCVPDVASEKPQSIWLYYAIGAVGVRVFAAKLPDKLGSHNFVVPALVSYCCAFLCLIETDTAQTYNLAGLLAGLGHGYCFPVLTGQVISRLHVSGTSRGLALFTALWELSSILTTGPLGAFADRLGLSAMCGLVVCCAVGLLMVWVVLEHRFLVKAHKKPAS